MFLYKFFSFIFFHSKKHPIQQVSTQQDILQSVNEVETSKNNLLDLFSSPEAEEQEQKDGFIFSIDNNKGFIIPNCNFCFYIVPNQELNHGNSLMTFSEYNTFKQQLFSSFREDIDTNLGIHTLNSHLGPLTFKTLRAFMPNIFVRRYCVYVGHTQKLGIKFCREINLSDFLFECSRNNKNTNPFIEIRGFFLQRTNNLEITMMQLLDDSKDTLDSLADSSDTLKDLESNLETLNSNHSLKQGFYSQLVSDAKENKITKQNVHDTLDNLLTGFLRDIWHSMFYDTADKLTTRSFYEEEVCYLSYHRYVIFDLNDKNNFYDRFYPDIDSYINSIKNVFREKIRDRIFVEISYSNNYQRIKLADFISIIEIYSRSNRSPSIRDIIYNYNLPSKNSFAELEGYFPTQIFDHFPSQFVDFFNNNNPVSITLQFFFYNEEGENILIYELTNTQLPTEDIYNLLKIHLGTAKEIETFINEEADKLIDKYNSNNEISNILSIFLNCRFFDKNSNFSLEKQKILKDIHLKQENILLLVEKYFRLKEFIDIFNSLIYTTSYEQEEGNNIQLDHSSCCHISLPAYNFDIKKHNQTEEEIDLPNFLNTIDTFRLARKKNLKYFCDKVASDNEFPNDNKTRRNLAFVSMKIMKIIFSEYISPSFRRSAYLELVEEKVISFNENKLYLQSFLLIKREIREFLKLFSVDKELEELKKNINSDFIFLKKFLFEQLSKDEIKPKIREFLNENLFPQYKRLDSSIEDIFDKIKPNFSLPLINEFSLFSKLKDISYLASDKLSKSDFTDQFFCIISSTFIDNPRIKEAIEKSLCGKTINDIPFLNGNHDGILPGISFIISLFSSTTPFIREKEYTKYIQFAVAVIYYSFLFSHHQVSLEFMRKKLFRILKDAETRQLITSFPSHAAAYLSRESIKKGSLLYILSSYIYFICHTVDNRFEISGENLLPSDLTPFSNMILYRIASIQKRISSEDMLLETTEKEIDLFKHLKSYSINKFLDLIKLLKDLLEYRKKFLSREVFLEELEDRIYDTSVPMFLISDDDINMDEFSNDNIVNFLSSEKITGNFSKNELDRFLKFISSSSKELNNILVEFENRLKSGKFNGNVRYLHDKLCSRLDNIYKKQVNFLSNDCILFDIKNILVSINKMFFRICEIEKELEEKISFVRKISKEC